MKLIRVEDSNAELRIRELVSDLVLDGISEGIVAVFVATEVVEDAKVDLLEDSCLLIMALSSSHSGEVVELSCEGVRSSVSDFLADFGMREFSKFSKSVFSSSPDFDGVPLSELSILAL